MRIIRITSYVSRRWIMRPDAGNDTAGPDERSISPRPTDQALPLLDRLDQATASSLAQINSLPFFQSLANNDLPLASYIALLHALVILLTPFEQNSGDAMPPDMRAIWNEQTSRLALLQRDLATLEPNSVYDNPESALRALLVAEQLRTRIQTL